MHSITLDFETFSEADIRKVGAYKYAADPSTEVLCLAWAIDDKEPQLWLPGDPHPSPYFLAFLQDARGNEYTFRAHNANFERNIWSKIMVQKHGWPEIPLRRWRCTMAACAYRALPLGLDEAGAVLKLATQKDKRGKELIRKLCQPRRPSKADPSIRNQNPDLLKELYEYCLQDVRAEQALHKVVGDLPPDEQEIWFLDQEINDVGVLVDIRTLRTCSAMVSALGARWDAEMVSLTAGEVESCSSSIALARWAGLPGVSKDAVETALAGEIDPAVRAALQLRQRAARSSTAKLHKLLDWAGDDGRVRGMLQYHGATTGRWAGRGPQPQNMPRPRPGYALPELLGTGDADAVEAVTGNVLETVASSLRGMYIAPPGHELIWCDFSAIEARVVLWLAEQEDALDIFRRGECIYCEMASAVFRKTVVKGMPERQDGKILILGAGFGLGGTKFASMYDLPEEEGHARIKAYRERFPKVPRLWKGLEEAARNAIKMPGSVFRYGKIAYKLEGDWLLCRLPSGRKLHYYAPELWPAAEPWQKEQITYRAVKQVDGGPKMWTDVRSYGGLLCENVTQAVARDLMCAAVMRFREVGFRTILTIHDEGVIELPTGYAQPAAIEKLMAEVPQWATDLPVQAEATKGKRYGK